MKSATQLVDSAPAIAVTSFGVDVPRSPFLNDTRIRRMQEGKYEGEEISGALAVVKPGDRVLEMGAGLGVVGAVIAKNAHPDAVLSFEANPNLIPHIQQLHLANGLDDIMEVRHQVVSAGPDRPDHVTFHLRNSFLGSSLIDTDRRETTPVDVPTVSYETVVKDFRPDILVIDIEGGELEFLRHANLKGIRAIVIEFHPGVYGKDGVRECKNILREVNFRRIEGLSTRFVWTCTREESWLHPDASWPDPAGGWSERIQTCTNAVIKPNDNNGLESESGVQTSRGHDVPMAAHWRNRRRLTQPYPVYKGHTQKLSGRWIWGGIIYSNFAHFIAESLGRLWAVDVVQGDVDGILFTPRRAGGHSGLRSVQADMFAALGVDLPVKVIETPHQVEELVVPGQGFGLGPIITGTQAYRDFRTRHFGKKIAPEGGEKIYISRSKLPADRGNLLGELYIEERLQDEGYEIYHPQAHSLNEQIARYKAAKQVVACDGSALHVLAFCGVQDQDVAMITRRESGASLMIAQHLEAFTGRPPLMISEIKKMWAHPATNRSRMASGEPNMAGIGQALADAGFISDGSDWSDLAPDLVKAELNARFKNAV